MNNYLKYFKARFIIVGILLIAYFGITLLQTDFTDVERTNDQHTDLQRVFDYAGVLSDREEAKLEKLIRKKQKQIGGDIILVTICERLQDADDKVSHYESFYNNANLALAKDFYNVPV